MSPREQLVAQIAKILNRAYDDTTPDDVAEEIVSEAVDPLVEELISRYTVEDHERRTGIPLKHEKRPVQGFQRTQCPRVPGTGRSCL